MTRQDRAIHLDGSHGEGGGQLVRTALSLAALTGQRFSVERIRARRANAGLGAQHVAAVRAAAEICEARVQGAEVGSRELLFEPSSPVRPGRYRWEIGTAGSTSLVFQTVLWPLALVPASSEVTLVGGTHVAWSPPVDYVREVFLLQAARLLDDVESHDLADVAVERWGWYPRGGGVIHARVPGGVRLRGMCLLDRGSLQRVSVLSAVSNLPQHIRRRQAERADHLLRKQGIRASVRELEPPSVGQGTLVFVLADYQNVRAGFTAYGRLRKPAEEVAEEACKAFVRYHRRKQPVDMHLGDQLLLPAALAACQLGEQTVYSAESLSGHLATESWVIRQFLSNVAIDLEGEPGGPCTVTVRRQG